MLSFLKNIFSGYKIPGDQFSITTLNLSLLCSSSAIISDKKSKVAGITVSYVECVISLPAHFKFFFQIFFSGFTVISSGVLFFVVPCMECTEFLKSVSQCFPSNLEKFWSFLFICISIFVSHIHGFLVHLK